jgi:nucleoid DNA-binding protein
MTKAATVNRRAFIARFMREGGLTYVQARRVYDTMVAVIEDGVCAGAKIKIGKVGSIYPVRRHARAVSMNFRMGQGRKVTAARHVFNIGPRICYQFRLFHRFMETHSLTWFNEQ